MSILNVRTAGTPTRRTQEILQALERDGAGSRTKEKKRNDGTRFTT